MKRLIAFASLIAACSGGGGGSDEPRTVFGGNRPVTIQVPSSYSEANPAKKMSQTSDTFPARTRWAGSVICAVLSLARAMNAV